MLLIESSIVHPIPTIWTKSVSDHWKTVTQPKRLIVTNG